MKLPKPTAAERRNARRWSARNRKWFADRGRIAQPWSLGRRAARPLPDPPTRNAHLAAILAAALFQSRGPQLAFRLARRYLKDQACEASRPKISSPTRVVRVLGIFPRRLCREPAAALSVFSR